MIFTTKLFVHLFFSGLNKHIPHKQSMVSSAAHHSNSYLAFLLPSRVAINHVDCTLIPQVIYRHFFHCIVSFLTHLSVLPPPHVAVFGNNSFTGRGTTGHRP